MEIRQDLSETYTISFVKQKKKYCKWNSVDWKLWITGTYVYCNIKAKSDIQLKHQSYYENNVNTFIDGNDAVLNDIHVAKFTV